MSIAVCLLLYGFTVAVLAPRVLYRFTRGGAAPRLGLAAWLSAIVSVSASAAFAVVAFVADGVRDLTSPGGPGILDECFLQLHDAATGRYGGIVQAGILALTGAAAAAGSVLAYKLIRTLLRARSTTHEHSRMARIAGRHHAGLDAVVIDVDEPAAYCVAGRPSTIVVTEGIIATLDDRHLLAVLAHERAHLTGRHHLFLALTRGLVSVFPRITLFRTAAIEVARLVEMCADDAAARTHGHRTVLEALIALSRGREHAGALSAVGVGVDARITRLAAPLESGQRVHARLRLGAATALVTIGPLVAALLAAGGIAVCASDERQDVVALGHPQADGISFATAPFGCGGHRPADASRMLILPVPIERMPR
ncbi:M56 family metallopeptidase [Nocardia farcinica]|uniref:M56 family metallopeptidase n=1 Tax=Nocardia farcinica TaxID=37329 RepID=UPI001894AECC|nr:M56 family metallopeptidase [Nocardia farcinica]MBF6422821.1 M56 family metallopeptidase [Nocardia farcinica]MBF6434552.1 M56 family metallopeptidase [Nocardia farcinica]MBF6505640.1 M56 family metallopeptidase [Nocardia farcinica]